MPDTHRTSSGYASAEKGSQNQSITPYQSLLEQIDIHTTVLTPNRRLAATLHKLHQQNKINGGDTCWQTPDILPGLSWIERLWQSHATLSFETLPHVLSMSQEQILWESILRQSKENPLLLQITETASTVKSAWTLLKQWQIKLDHPALRSTDDYASMQKWAETFQSICQQRNWIDKASLPDLLTAYIKQDFITLPAQIILTGFTDISPQLQHLLDACREQHTQINFYMPPEHTNKHTHRCQPLDRDDEIVTIARWAKAIHDQQPEATIGCVIPTLDEVRDQAEQVFSEVFYPPGTNTDKNALPFNISAGKPISHYPVIQSALTLLSLVKPSISIDTFNQILATPFIGEAEQERVMRAHIDSLLRKSNVITIKLPAISNILDKHGPHFAKRIHAFVDKLKTCKPYQTHAEWVSFISDALNAMGWPGERSINSEEYQTIQRWLSLLIEFKQFDQVSTPINITDAIDRLNQLASKSFYQPQTPDAPVQVLGLLEAAALPFDYLWVSGLDDISWPPAPKPNPFIPKQLQRERQMPHATAERELLFCTTVMQQFSNTSGILIYSHAAKNEKIELQASPLIRTIPPIDSHSMTLASHLSTWDTLFEKRNHDVLTDLAGPAITPDTKSIGGVNIIKNQAICPFKAFAEHRLHAQDIETPVPGLRAKDRGNIIHQIMEQLWTKLKSQTALLQLSDNDLKKEIENAITSALKSDANSRLIYQHYTQLEHRRLQKLIWQWMQIEKARNPFKVSATEQKIDVQLGDLSFTCKIDRLDTLDDERSIIIDYKTGKNNDQKGWFGNRPDEPQLPIYALSNQKIAAIAYAQINATECELIGVSGNDLEIKGIKPIETDWQEQIVSWQAVLTQLANNFAAGHAMVDPKDAVKSCEYCQLKPLCRIHEENPYAN